MPKPKILLVEDSDSVRESIATMLAPRYSVTTARDASEALELVRRARDFPVVVSDYSMPGEDGIRLLERLAGEQPETVGILITGVAEPGLAAKAIQEGRVFRLLDKPCSYETLASAIDAGLARHAQLEARANERERMLFANESLYGMNELLEERVMRQTRALRRLNVLSIELASAGSLRRIAELAARATFDVLPGRGVHVQLWDGAGAEGGVRSSCGPEMSANMRRIAIGTHEGDIGELVLEAGRCDGRELGGPDLSLLESLAAAIATAAHNELRRRERDRAYDALILALARLSEARDNETGKHLERVASYCRLLSEGLQRRGLHLDDIDEEWTADLVRASPLHDIGKVGVPDSILLKPAKLTPEEWEIMKTHSEIGANTLDGVLREYGQQRILEMGRDICGAHHEKWDGSGYPEGLAGDDIPVAARLMALADVFDALICKRVYKPAWAINAARDLVLEQRGRHFDPAVADAFEAGFEDCCEIARHFADSPEAAMAA